MSAAARTRLGRIARAVVPSRARRLAHALEGQSWPAIAYDDLVQAPDWLALPDADRRRLAQLAQLALLSPAIARSIDGRWLGSLAETAGAEAIDWAMALADEGPAGLGVPEPIAANALDEAGEALLAATLSPALAARVSRRAGPPAALATWALARAEARMRAL
jgi:hypothetical protein